MNHYEQLTNVILELKATNACKHAVETLEVVAEDLRLCMIEEEAANSAIAEKYEQLTGNNNRQINDLNKQISNVNSCLSVDDVLFPFKLRLSDES